MTTCLPFSLLRKMQVAYEILYIQSLKQQHNVYSVQKKNRLNYGIKPNTIRLSIGIGKVEDLHRRIDVKRSYRNSEWKSM